MPPWGFLEESSCILWSSMAYWTFIFSMLWRTLIKEKIQLSFPGGRGKIFGYRTHNRGYRYLDVVINYKN
jgi:hypothetical protein